MPDAESTIKLAAFTGPRLANTGRGLFRALTFAHEKSRRLNLRLFPRASASGLIHAQELSSNSVDPVESIVPIAGFAPHRTSG